MPTYDLECSKCGHKFELFLTRFIRDDDRVCPECGSTDVSQTISDFNMWIGCGSTGRGNIGARVRGTPYSSQKFMKYRDPKYRKK